MCKVEFSEQELGYRTLGHLRLANFTDKELFIEYLTARLGVLTDAYTTHPISKITFSYIVKNGLAAGNRRLLQDLSTKLTTSHRFNNMNLPITMNPTEYGTVILDNYIQINGENIHRFMVRNGTRIYTIDVSKNGLVNHVTIEGAIDLSWIDTKVSDDLIKREIGKSIIFFMNGERVLTKKQLNAHPFKRAAVDTELNSNFVTMDVETINLLGKITPYLICAYNGTNSITSYGQQIKGVIDQKTLFSSFINQLLTFFSNDSKTMVVYAHNFSKFDGVFLLKHLLSYGKVEPIIFNGKLMSIKVKLNVDGYKDKTIVFKDSLLLLPLSLRKLCLAFSVDTPKGYFPFLLTNIFYTGVIPKFEYWTGISLSDYTSLKNEHGKRMWSFEQEAIKYCILDCKCLHDVLIKFNELIFNYFKVNINSSLTLPSLAMRIYKSQFMPENTIYQLLGKVEQNIRNCYTGGAVDVYIPHNRINAFARSIRGFFTKLFVYDVNSLYPFIMAETPMPVGKPIAFKGDITKIDPNAFGYFYCKITSPDYLEHPILQRRIKTSEGLRTIAGLGSWTGWIFSTEMFNAMKYGYTFEILEGYEFERGNVFKEYVQKMYNLRLEFEKGHAMNLIAKLLMNSIYGKLGMKMDVTRVDIFDISDELKIQEFKEKLEVFKESILDYIKLDQHIVIVRDSIVDLRYNEGEDMYFGLDVNIALASAITAGARVHMSIFKNNPDFKLYYSDTDSGVFGRALPTEYVGTRLGQFKLEHVIDRAV